MGVTLLFLGFALVGQTGARYDAATHKLEARGVAAADLRAPSAAIARVRAERSARLQAEKRLKAALVELRAKLEGAALDGKVAAALSAVEYGSDGSIELTLTLATDGVELGRKR